MLDTGATFSFVDREFVRRHRITIRPVVKRALELTDDTKGFVTHFVEIDLTLDRHRETLLYYVIPKLSYPIILG